MAEGSLSFIAVQSDEMIEKTAKLADEIWHECYAEILKPQQIDYMVGKMQSAPAIKQQIFEEGYEYYIVRTAAPESADAGYIGIQPQEGGLYLSKLYLLAHHRGNGYTDQIMEYVEQAGRRLGCSGVWLTVNRYNQQAIKVYRHIGYTVAREQVADIGGGYVMDDFVFEKPL